MEEPDPAVVDSAAAGDRQAFTLLVRGTQEHVWRFIRHLVGDDDLASDLTQETYLRVHRSLRTFRGDASFCTWVLRIAQNLVTDEHRRAARRPVLVQLPDSFDVGDGAAAPSLLSELEAALATLPPDQRVALLLIEVLGLRYREASEVLDIAEGTIKSRVFHARSNIVRWMQTGERTEQNHG